MFKETYNPLSETNMFKSKSSSVVLYISPVIVIILFCIALTISTDQPVSDTKEDAFTNYATSNNENIPLVLLALIDLGNNTENYLPVTLEKLPSGNPFINHNQYLTTCNHSGGPPANHFKINKKTVSKNSLNSIARINLAPLRSPPVYLAI